MTRFQAILSQTVLVALFLLATSASAQVRGGIYSFGFGPRIATYGGTNFAGTPYTPVPLYYGRASLPGPAGPRPVTWYTPGLGYASNVQTGLPWEGPSPIATRASVASSYRSNEMAVARQERVRRRMETLHAVNHHQLGRDYPKFLDQSLVADSKWNKQTTPAAAPAEPATLPAAAKLGNEPPTEPEEPVQNEN